MLICGVLYNLLCLGCCFVVNEILQGEPKRKQVAKLPVFFLCPNVSPPQTSNQSLNKPSARKREGVNCPEPDCIQWMKKGGRRVSNARLCYLCESKGANSKAL